MRKVGDRVRFVNPDLRDRFGGGQFEIDRLDRHTGGVGLKEFSGHTFDSEDLSGHESGPRTRTEAAETRLSVEGEVEVRELIRTLSDALPEPMLTGSEAGYRDSSFYRFPIIGQCWCGRPYRYTLDGAVCEERHVKG